MSHQNLRADDVDTGDDFCDRMLHLNARIYLDEAPIAAFDIDEKLDGAGVEVFRLACDSHRCSADFVANPRVERNGWRHFDNLLMAALDRAVALIKMEDVPVMISKDLNLDVLGPADIALEENGIIAKRCRRLLPRFGNLGLKLAFGSNDPHPTPPSAERCLNDQRESNLGGHSPGYGRCPSPVLRCPESPARLPSGRGAAQRSCRRATGEDRPTDRRR